MGSESRAATSGAASARCCGAARQHGFHLVQLLLGRVLTREARRELELLGDGVQRGVEVIGGALVAQGGVRLGCDLLAQHLGQTRFADAWLRRRPTRPVLPRRKPVASGAAAAPPPLCAPRTASVQPHRWAASKRPPCLCTASTRHARTGCAMPLSDGHPDRSARRQPRTRRRVVGAITTSSGPASPCSRAARLGVSPTASLASASSARETAPTTTVPVATPMRTASGGSARTAFTACTISRAARTLRSASSSWALGQPK